MSKKGKYFLDLKKLCTPAFIYFVISALGMFMIGIQNLNGSSNTLCLGVYKCGVINKALVFVFHAIYILFWTFILDLFCKTGYQKLSWLIVMIPIVLSFVLADIMIYKTKI